MINLVQQCSVEAASLGSNSCSTPDSWMTSGWHLASLRPDVIIPCGDGITPSGPSGGPPHGGHAASARHTECA